VKRLWLRFAPELSKSFGGLPAISDVSLEVRGRAALIIGPNGAGKTTLFNWSPGPAARRRKRRPFGEDVTRLAPHHACTAALRALTRSSRCSRRTAWSTTRALSAWPFPRRWNAFRSFDQELYEQARSVLARSRRQAERAARRAAARAASRQRHRDLDAPLVLLDDSLSPVFADARQDVLAFHTALDERLKAFHLAERPSRESARLCSRLSSGTAVISVSARKAAVQR